MAGSAESTSVVDLNPAWAIGPDHVEWRQRVKDFCEARLAPTVAERTIEGRFANELVLELGEQGFFGARVSPEHGGLGLDLTSMCLMLEEVSRVDGSIANLVEAQSVMGVLLEAMASEEQKRELLPQMVSGEALVAFGLTEATGGSDAGNMVTRAERVGEDWVIDGAKDMISTMGTDNSRYVLTFAATGPGRSPRRPEVSAFLVPVDAEGVTLSEPYAKLGWIAADTRTVHELSPGRRDLPTARRAAICWLARAAGRGCQKRRPAAHQPGLFGIATSR